MVTASDDNTEMIKDDHDKKTKVVITVLGHLDDQHEDMNMMMSPFIPRLVNNGDWWIHLDTH